MTAVFIAANSPWSNKQAGVYMRATMRILPVLLALFYSTGVAQFNTSVSGTGTTAAAFLEIGVGARAMGMGGAYTAISDGPTAMFYNPAAIVWMDGYQAEFMHNEWFVGTSHDWLGFVSPLPFFNSSLGISFTSLNYGEQKVRTAERPEGTGELYDALDFAVSLTYAAALTENFSLGLTGKYIQQQIWNMSGSTAALDLGVFYKPPVEGLSLGMSITNFGSEIGLSGRDLDTTVDPDPDHENVDRVPATLKTDTYPLPILFRAGISYEFQMLEFTSVLLSTDLLHPTNTTESVNVGIELGFREVVFLRAGYENLFESEAENGLTLGAGVDIYLSNNFGVRADYAYGDWGLLDSVSRFSIGFAF
jgi:hypothetical protein